MITFIIQARSGSTRLPNKILRPFYEGECILDLILEKLSLIDNTDVLIATTSNQKDDLIARMAKNHGVGCFRGAENDVLDRFISAADENNVQQIIRVCSDNPFLDVNSMKQLLETIQKNPRADYISFNVNGTPSIKTHYGFWTEYVTLDALKKVKRLTDEPLYHEHVTNYIYSHPDDFNIVWINAGQELVKGLPIRLTIDTEADFVNAQKIYSEFEQKGVEQTIYNIVAYMLKNPLIASEMAIEIKKNTK